MKKASRFEGPDESPGFLLWQVSTEWRRKVESALVAFELTHPQFVLLAGMGWLAHLKADVTQVELARFCNMDITMTSQVLRTLEKKGLIKRERRGGNERSKFPCLTARGGQLIERAIPCVEEIDLAFFGRLGGKERLCVELLQQLTRELH